MKLFRGRVRAVNAGLLAGLAAGAMAWSLAGVSTAMTGQAVTPRCTNADLVATYRSADSGAGHHFGWLRLRNTSDHACTVRGYGGLSYVGNGDGTQIGAAAGRDDSGVKVRTITLQTGERAKSRVNETAAGNYPKKRCKPAAVDGFRVYVPGATASQYVEHPTTGCRKTSVHLISHRPYKSS